MLREILEKTEKYKDRLSLSITKLKVYESCPYRYYLQNIVKEKVPKSEYNPKFFKIGQYAHKYMESKFKNIPCQFKSSSLTKDDYENTSKKCDIALETPFVKKLLNLDYETEMPFSMNFMSDGTVEVSDKYSRKSDFAGFIDYYGIDKKENTLYVIDWKTGNVAKDNDETFLQVYLYAYALNVILKTRPFDKIVVGYYYLDHNEKLIREVKMTDLQRTIENLISRGLEIPHSDKAEDFPATPSEFVCKWCPYGYNGTGSCEFKK